MTKEVDVVIVTFGGGAFLADCIAAVRRQGSAVGRVIVIDNASPDDTADVAEAIGGVEVVRNGTNAGYAAAMNQAFVMTSGEFLLSLNADCVLEDGYVERCMSCLRTDDTVAAVTGVLRLEDGRIDSTGVVMSEAGRAADRDRHEQRPTAPSVEPFGVSGAAALWRRSALASLGDKPWWEWLFVYWDDVEISWRLRRAGWTFRCAHDAGATHRRGSDSADADFIESQSLRNRLATIARHRGWTGLLAPSSVALTAVTMVRLAVRHPKALWRAKPARAVAVGLTERARDTA
ncbi:MAG: hypothetical protein QOF21_343 [Actinomycetota bacterium]|jgi:GT2 family glycosyltransferase